MTKHSPLSRDAEMVQGMANANGLDLPLLTQTGRITADQVSDLVQSCGRCANKTGCVRWLDRHVTAVTTTPGFCRNKPQFDDLRAG